MDCVHYWEVGPWGGGGAPTGLIAPGATHPRYATADADEVPDNTSKYDEANEKYNTQFLCRQRTCRY
jgi:hypothetical protein